MIRNFASTVPLLCTVWAQKSYELVNEIRYQSCLSFKGGVSWELVDDNVKYLEGIIADPTITSGIHSHAFYIARREELGVLFPRARMGKSTDKRIFIYSAVC